MWMDNWVLNLPLSHWPELTPGALDTHRVLFRFFETRRPLVVLASSNKPDVEAHEKACAELNVPIVKRRGGGGTVVLGPGCLILTLAFYAKDVFGNAHYFSLINELWAAALETAGIEGVVQKGISDLAVGEKKIAGTSLFRRKHLLVYQGSLLVDPDFELISKLLAHPSREPEYRGGRSHIDFLTSTRQLGHSISAAELGLKCTEYFNAHLWKAFSKEFFVK